MKEHTNHYYLINSKDANTPTESKNDIIIKPHNFDRVTSFKIKKIIVPYTFYTINSNNNVLTIFKNGDTVDRSITITNGDYSLAQFITELKTKLDALAGPPQTYTITDNDVTHKLTIAQNSSTFIIRGKSSSLNRVMGFTNVDTSNAISHTASNIYNLSGTHFIKVHSNQLTKYDTKIRTSGAGGNDLLLTIPLSKYQFGDLVYYEPKNDYLFDYHSHAESNIDIILRDDENKLLGGSNGLNGQNYIIDLQFQTERKQTTQLRDEGFSREL